MRAIDFMPPRGEAPDIVRIVEGLDGEVPMRSELVIRFDFGNVVPWVRRVDHARVAVAGPDALCFRTPAPTRGQDMTTVSHFTSAPGRPHAVRADVVPVAPAGAGTDGRRGGPRGDRGVLAGVGGALLPSGDYHDEIHHSLLVLKALTYAPTGGIVAAPTTSLPEQLGGERNWDYRFCWLRDATLTLRTMLAAGYNDEALEWRKWLLRAIAGDPADLQIMYGIAGERRLDERELEWLPGYEDSQPVRVGNAASRQLQLDVYGELLDAAYQTQAHGVPGDPAAWALLRALLGWLEQNWRREDAGIWEVRGPNRHFTHSKVMAWVAFDRAIRFHDEFGRQGPVERWRTIRDEIRSQVLSQAWNPSKQAFVQSYGSDQLDASTLLMPAVGFIAADDPRMVATVEAIQRELLRDGLVQRYQPMPDGAVDGIASDEGVFLPCSFWLADALAAQGRLTEARELFERLLDLRNDVGLLSEEYDPVTGRQLGNMPQAFTHLSLINTAMVIGEGRQVRGGRARP